MPARLTATFTRLTRRTGAVQWRYRTNGVVFSSPAVVDGKVFFGSDDGHVYALDGNSRVPAQPASQPQAVRPPPDESAAQNATDFIWRSRIEYPGTPTVADGAIYVGSDDGYLYLLDAASGDVRQRRKVGYLSGSAPVVVGDVVYAATTDGILRALDGASLEQQWRFSTGDDNASAPAVADGSVYAGSKDGHVYGIDAASGELLWRFRPDTAARTGPAAAGGLVFVGSGRRQRVRAGRRHRRGALAFQDRCGRGGCAHRGRGPGLRRFRR